MTVDLVREGLDTKSTNLCWLLPEISAASEIECYLVDHSLEITKSRQSEITDEPIGTLIYHHGHHEHLEMSLNHDGLTTECIIAQKAARDGLEMTG